MNLTNSTIKPIKSQVQQQIRNTRRIKITGKRKIKKWKKRETIRSGIKTCIAVGDVDGALEGSSEENSDDALPGVTRHPIVVVDNAEQYQRVHHHLLDWPRQYLLRFYHVHFASIVDVSPLSIASPFCRAQFQFLERKEKLDSDLCLYFILYSCFYIFSPIAISLNWAFRFN